MRLQIELAFRGRNFAERVRRYDDFMGCMVRGFHFRLRPLYFELVWRSDRR